MNGSAIIVAALALACASCKDGDSETKLRRSKGKAAVVMVGANEAKAGALVQEQEPNDELGQAQSVGLDANNTGSLGGSLDVDRYQIEVGAEGVLFVMVVGAEDADLILELQKDDGTTLALSDRGPKGTVEGVAGYWVEAGARYQLVVREFTKRKLRKTGGRVGASAPYRLSVTMATPKPDYEVEPNEDLEGAKELGLGTPEHGFLGWSGDTDWWRIPVTGFSETSVQGEALGTRAALDIVVSGTTKVATIMELVTAAGETIATLVSAPGKEVALRSFVPDRTADFYILKLHAKRSNPEEPYQVRLDSTALSAGQEEEPNGSMELANTIASEVGVLAKASGELSMGDVDMFSIAPAPMNRSMDLRLEGPSTADLTVSVVSEAGKLLAISAKPGLGLSEMLEAVNVAPFAAPIVIIRAAKVDLPAGYQLSLSVSEGQGVAQAPTPAAEETTDSVE